ncbi:MAG: NAD(P)-dependent oxidoreductase [Candidatus Dojkabacteria bacterium]|nr:NAD(P)-dependent oxidoreductase [Candidatus Dojkabacteria bacterium]
MKVIVVKESGSFRKEDIKLLNDLGAKFYENISFEAIRELVTKEEKILAVQPAALEGRFESLPWIKLRKIRNLRALVLATTAFGWVDIKKLNSQGTIVCNCPGKATDSVAEGGFLSLLTLLRKIPLLVQNNFKHSVRPAIGSRVEGMKVGIVGLGKIGKRFAEICEKNGCRIYYWNRTKKRTNYTFMELPELFSHCDCIYLSFATNPYLSGFISNRLVDRMKKTSLIISCIDNLVFDKGYIIDKVKKGALGGFAYEEEGVVHPARGNIWAVPNSYYYNTKDTFENESRIFTETIISVVDGKPINRVDC